MPAQKEGSLVEFFFPLEAYLIFTLCLIKSVILISFTSGFLQQKNVREIQKKSLSY